MDVVAWDDAGVDEESMTHVAGLLGQRNIIDKEIARIIRRPMTSGHLGEWIAAQIFDIELEKNAAALGIDGSFRSGPLQGRTVNVKWYLKQEGVLDTTDFAGLDYYLVLAGPPSSTGTSRDGVRPWCIQSVFLFDTRQLRAQQAARCVKRGIASSVIKQQWTTAEIYPSASNALLAITSHQAELLKLFHLPADSC